MSDNLTPAGERSVRLAPKVAKVLALHRRRPHSANGGVPSFGSFDFVAHGQTEFPDLCDHCRTNWPCATIAAMEDS